MALSMQRALLILLAVNLAACGGGRVAAADDSLPSEDEAAETFAWAKEAFAQIDCRSNGTQAHRLEPRDQSLLRWSNPEVGRVFGDFFLFTSDRRPAALVALYAWHRPGNVVRFAEFLSLSEEPLKATAGEDVLWNTGPGDLDWKTFEPRVIPATSAPARLSQMRSLVARFEIVLDDRREHPQSQLKTLRRLTRPLFRYANADAGLVDGALFAFVASTDPDALVLVEARENGRAEKAWHYAVARVHCAKLTVKLEGTAVAQFPYMRDRKFDPRGPYSVAKWPKQRRVREAADRAELDADSKVQEN